MDSGRVVKHDRFPGTRLDRQLIDRRRKWAWKKKMRKTKRDVRPARVRYGFATIYAAQGGF